MNPVTHLPTYIANPGQARVRGFGHRSRHIEVKDGLGCSGTFLGQPSPASVAGTGHTIAADAVTDKIDIGVVLVGRPMVLEVIKKCLPIRWQVMSLEIPEGKREAMIDTNHRRLVFQEPFNQPLGQRLVASNTYVDLEEVEPQKAASPCPKCRPADLSDSMSEFLRPNSRCRCNGRKPKCGSWMGQGPDPERIRPNGPGRVVIRIQVDSSQQGRHLPTCHPH